MSVSISVVLVKQFFAEDFESLDHNVTCDDQVGNFTIDLVLSSGVDRLQSHQSEKFLGPSWQEIYHSVQNTYEPYLLRTCNELE